MGRQADRRSIGGRRGFFREVGSCLAEAVRLRVRYETPDENGETRAERNERFDEADKTPEIETPEDWQYLLDWFWDIHSARSHGFNGPNPMSLTDIANWSAMTGNQLLREEVAIIRQIDAAYVEAVGVEMMERMERAKAKPTG